MQITHEEFRTLIDFNADHALNAQEKGRLAAHLKGCSECRAYAEEIKEVENLLLPVMNAKWNLRPVPLSIQSLIAKQHARFQASNILTMRTALISLVFAVFVFSAWQFVLTGRQTPGQSPVSVLPAPTPSALRAQSTSTRVMFNNCDMLSYAVQEHDTLASIARQFLTSKEALIVLNDLKTEAINPTMKLKVPACHFTPTSTILAGTFTTTYTPGSYLTTSTPGGGG